MEGDGWMNGGSVLHSHTGYTGDFKVAGEVHGGQFRALLERHDRTWLNGCGEGVRRRGCATILF